MNKRVGLFGGTFDPVHNGHISIAQSFIESSLIDELWILLTPFPPHKDGNKHASYEYRKEMLEIAFLGKKNIRILTIENKLPKPSYSFNTIKYLKETHPNIKFLYCMGEDNIANFDSWKHHSQILEELELLVAHRPGVDHSEVKDYVLARTTFADHTPISVSSSMIKEKIDQKELLAALLPKKVLNFIVSKDLYKSNF